MWTEGAAFLTTHTHTLQALVPQGPIACALDIGAVDARPINVNLLFLVKNSIKWKIAF